jgi:hypothetical protein
MTGAFSPAIWRDPTPLLVLGTGAALPGEPIATEASYCRLTNPELGGKPWRQHEFCYLFFTTLNQLKLYGFDLVSNPSVNTPLSQR